MKNFNILGVHRKFVGCSGVGECPKKSNIEWVIVYKGGEWFWIFWRCKVGGEGGLERKRGWCFWGGCWYPWHSMASPQKKWFFCLNPYKIEVMRTSLRETIFFTSYENRVTWPHLQYNLSRVIKFCWWCHGLELWHHHFYFKIALF